MLAVYTLLACWVAGSSAQNLPLPSRTVFKCESDGKIRYSDSPCLGAKKLEIEPTRGVNKLSAKERISSEGRHERLREDMAAALRPLTGMDAKQTEILGRRLKLSEAVRRECLGLDLAIQQSEGRERAADKEALGIVQVRLFTQRRRFRELGC